MSECKTLEFLKNIHEADESCCLIARSAIGIIDTIRNSEKIDPTAVAYLHELIEYLYSIGDADRLSHLQDSPDCEICAALLALNS